MRASPSEATALGGRAPTANDEWKSRWSVRLGWATTASVAIHALLFVFSPSWDRSDPRLEPPELEERPWIVLSALPEGALPGDLVVVPPAAGESDTLPPAPEILAGGENPGGTSGRSGTSILDRLRGSGAPVPTVVEPEPPEETPAAESPEREGGEGTDIEGSASAAEIVPTLEEGGLDLDRLSAIRPELALVGSSDWIRVRNPSQVERYMARAYTAGRVSPEASGQVALTLWIDERGSVEWAEIAQSSGREELDEVALALFNDVVAFEPALEEGVPVSAPATFWVRFPWF